MKYHYLLPRLEDIGGPADIRQWAAVLRSASAFEAFRKVYGNWMNGVVLVVLWKFWWAIILLCMSVRLQAFQDVLGEALAVDEPGC